MAGYIIGLIQNDFIWIAYLIGWIGGGPGLVFLLSKIVYWCYLKRRIEDEN